MLRHKRERRHISEQHPKTHPQRQNRPHKPWLPSQTPHRHQQSQRPLTTTLNHRQALGQPQQRHHKAQRGHHRQHPKAQLPRPHQQKLRTQQRRQERSQHHHQRQPREEPHRAVTLEQVTHHSPSNHRPRRTGHTLHKPQHDEHRHVRHEHTQHRRHREHGTTHQQRATTPPGITHRPDHQLTQRKPEHHRGQRQLHLRLSSPQRLGDLRKRGQIHVGGQRSHGCHQPQDHHQQHSSFSCTRHGGRRGLLTHFRTLRRSEGIRGLHRHSNTDTVGAVDIHNRGRSTNKARPIPTP